MRAAYSSSKEFTPIEEGSHVGVFTGLVDLGVQPSFNPQYKPSHQIAVQVTFPGAFDDSGNAHVVTQYVTSSIGKKAKLRKWVEGAFGKAFPSEDAAKEFDFKALLGRAALFQIKHATSKSSGKTRANIEAVLSMPAGLPKPTYNGKLLYSTFEAPDAELPEFLKQQQGRRLANSEDELKALAQQDDDAAGGGYVDDVPF